MYLEYGRENGSYIESQIYTRRIENKFHLGLQCTVRKIIIAKIPVIEDQLYAVYLHAKYIQISIFFRTLFPFQNFLLVNHNLLFIILEIKLQYFSLN